MTDDRHEAYRTMYILEELSELFEAHKANHGIEYIAYRLMRLQRDYPKETITSIVLRLKTELNV